MADEKGGFASAFDRLLEQNRQQFDRIMSAPAQPRPASATTPPASGVTARPPRRRFGPLDPDRSVAVRDLDQRFGPEGWRYEITERRRAGGEMIVLCRLTLAGRNVTKSQFGVAELAGTGIAAEEAAVAQAAEAALANCTKLL